jgi:hypothetical protein
VDERADLFVKQFSLSKPFVYAVNGFWALDSGDSTTAVRCLSDPSVNLDDSAEVKFGWNEKILKALFKFEAFQDALFFIQTISISCWTEEIVSLVLQTYCKSNIIDAIKFQRKFAGKHTLIYLNMLFDQVFKPSQLSNVEMLLSASLLPFEEQCLADYCEKSKNVLCHKFLITYYIQQGRYPEALRSNEKLCKNNTDVAYQQMILDISMMLPPTIRKVFKIPKLSETKFSKKQTTLSQASSIRGRMTTEADLLKALQENYVEIIPESAVLNTQIPEDVMDIDNTFERQETDTLMLSITDGPGNVAVPLKQNTAAPIVTQEKLTTPSRNAMEFKVPSAVKQSPASPFMQPPFTPQKQTVSPFANAERRTPSDLKQFKSPRKSNSESPLVQVPRSMVPTIETQKSPFMNAPPLINRSPFASTPSISKPMSVLSTGLGVTESLPQPILSPPKVTRSTSAQTQDSVITTGIF